MAKQGPSPLACRFGSGDARERLWEWMGTTRRVACSRPPAPRSTLPFDVPLPALAPRRSAVDYTHIRRVRLRAGVNTVRAQAVCSRKSFFVSRYSLAVEFEAPSLPSHRAGLLASRGAIRRMEHPRSSPRPLLYLSPLATPRLLATASRTSPSRLGFLAPPALAPAPGSCLTFSCPLLTTQPAYCLV